jgi:hypothetical protein
MQARRSRSAYTNSEAQLLTYASAILLRVPRDGEGSKLLGHLANLDQTITKFNQRFAKYPRGSFRAAFLIGDDHGVLGLQLALAANPIGTLVQCNGCVLVMLHHRRAAGDLDALNVEAGRDVTREHRRET